MPQVVPADPVAKELCLGLPVAGGDVIGLVHQASGQHLCRERSLADTEFGVESPTSLRTVKSNNKRSTCEASAKVSTVETARWISILIESGT